MARRSAVIAAAVARPPGSLELRLEIQQAKARAKARGSRQEAAEHGQMDCTCLINLRAFFPEMMASAQHDEK
eukprot:6082639-Alexandrium_andersonii.AAC.1